MSSTSKWVTAVIVIIVVLLGLWWGGFLGGGAPATGSQSATALSGATDTVETVDFSDATVADAASAIDAQMKVAGNQFATFTQSATAAKADLLSTQLGGVATLLSNLATRLKARIASLKGTTFDTTVIQGALSDMTLQISYARSQAGLGGQLAAKAKAEGAKNNLTLQQVVIELQKSKSYLEAAQKDVKTIIAGFKTISDSQTKR